MTPKYLIAKYIPDLRRGEPRNVGVVLWTPQRVLARFLGEKDDEPGAVDGRALPGFISSTAAYKQWVAFWQLEIAKGGSTGLTSNRTIPCNSPQFLEALASFSKGNFFLADGGFLLDSVQPEDLPLLASHLFQNLVVQAQEEPRDPSLDEICERLISDASLTDDPNFKSHYPLKVTLAPGLEENFEFSHAYGNGTPKRLYQRVPLSRQRTPRRKSVHDTAWMFEKVIPSVVARESAVALVFATPEQRSDTEIDRSIQVLESVCRVLNVSNEEEALNEFRALRSLALH